MSNKHSCDNCCNRKGNICIYSDVCLSDNNGVGAPTHYKAFEIVEQIKEEMVNHPSHYNQGSIEVIDFIEDWELDFTTANIIKYVVRSPYKNNALEDLKKAKFYLERLINRYEKSSIQK